MAEEVVLVLDCGATNIAAVAVDGRGRPTASFGEPNGPVMQAGAPEDWCVWDFEQLWGKVSSLAGRVCAKVGAQNVKALTVTTWGADGAPIRADGTLAYPTIAWKCRRTVPIAEELSEKLGARRLYDITGYQVIGFSTLFKLVWLRRNAPEALDDADKWMMMPGLLSHRLCGQMSIDVTSASTTMAIDLRRACWSGELLAQAGLDESFFPPMVYPGSVIGGVTGAASRQTGVPEGTPVVAAGHDTQFAPIGSGAGQDEAVLSSGTWEILMLRTAQFEPNDVGFSEGLITELDAVPGLYNPQILMMGSGVLEWVRENLYADIPERDRAYPAMVAEASRLKPGAGGVMMVPGFMPDTGPTRKYNTHGTIVGLRLDASRAHVYRAALEGLAFQLKDALRILSAATGFRPAGLRVVGGGARNDLWNRIRADVCGLPVRVTRAKEATVLGAAVAAWVGAGRFADIEEGRQALATEASVLEPSADAQNYEELFERYRMLPPALQGFYSSK